MYMPLALYFLICIFEGFQLSYALSILVGYMSQKGYLDRFKPSSYYFEQLESANGWLHSISRSRGWVLAGASLGHDAWIPVNTVDPDMRAERQQNHQSSFGSSFQSAPSSQGAATHSETPSQAHPVKFFVFYLFMFIFIFNIFFSSQALVVNFPMNLAQGECLASPRILRPMQTLTQVLVQLFQIAKS